MSLVSPSVQAREGNRVAWQTQWWSSYVFANKPRLRLFLTGCTLRCDVTLSLSLSHTQTAIKIADVLWCDPVSLSLSHTHTMRKTVKGVRGCLCETRQNQRYSPIKKKQHNLDVRFEPFPLIEFSPPLVRHCGQKRFSKIA